MDSPELPARVEQDDAHTPATSGKYTPGPWRVIGPDANDQPVVTSADYEVATCWHHCVASIERESHANAVLIAAAPDLLEAAQGVSSLLALIAEGFWEECPYPEANQRRIAALKAAIAKATQP